MVHQEYRPQGLRNVPVNSAAYLQTEENKIPIEERFFYKYFTDHKKTAKTKKGSEKEEQSDVESVDDEEFDEFMDNYFTSNTRSDVDKKKEGELDFAAEVQKKVKGKKRKVEEEAESEDDDEEEAIDFDGDDDADELIDLDNAADDMDFDCDHDDDLGSGENFENEAFEEFGGKAFKQKLKMRTQKTPKGMKGDEMFAPAEEFAEMLESNADIAFSGSNTLINKDNSNLKQLKWETERDRWVKGYKNNSKEKFNTPKGKRRKLK